MTAKIHRANSLIGRQRAAGESFGCAAKAIGDILPAMSLFIVTRGQWSMIDAVLHCLDQVGPARLSIWTWTVAEYEVQVLTRLREDRRLTDGTLVIDAGARNKNREIIREWKGTFGAESVRYVQNHAKIATIETAGGVRLLLRGSANLNANPRFENFDISEGGPEFDLVQAIEAELPILADDCDGAQVYAATKLSTAFSADELAVFKGVRVWAK